MMRPRLAAPALTFALALLARTPSFSSTLEEDIDAVLKRPPFHGSSFGLLFVEVESGDVVYEHRPHALLPPASTVKLVSSAGALAVLGADFRFETSVVRTGPLEEGVVSGDLILVASGDPNLSQRLDGNGRLRFTDHDHSYAGYTSARLVPGDPAKVLRSLAAQLAEAGVREIHGDVIVDDGIFKETHDSFVGPFSAVSINDNVVDITIRPGAALGAAAVVEYQPRLPSVRVGVDAYTAEKGGTTDLWVERDEGPASFVVRGAIAGDSHPVLRVGQIADPALAAAHFFADVLEEDGITVRGKRSRARFGPAIYKRFDVAARHVSPPFSESVRVTLKVSQNLHATMYPVILGALRGERADREGGYALIRKFLARGGLDVDSVVLESGSGGGLSDRLSARFTVDLLRFMSTRREFPAFYDALPIGGVDGTLASRFRSSRLGGKVRAKTGTLVYKGAFNDHWIYLSKALAGYLESGASGPARPQLAFSILIANTVATDREAGAEALFRAQEDIIEAVLDHWREE